MSRRIRRLETFHEFLLNIRARISFSAQSLEEIFRAGGNEFSRSIIPYLQEQDLPAAYDAACCTYFPDTKDKELALAFLRDFGRSDLENQLIHLDTYCGLVKRAEDDARNVFQSKTRVSLAFYSFLGAAAAILLV